MHEQILIILERSNISECSVEDLESRLNNGTDVLNYLFSSYNSKSKKVPSVSLAADNCETDDKTKFLNSLGSLLNIQQELSAFVLNDYIKSIRKDKVSLNFNSVSLLKLVRNFYLNQRHLCWQVLQELFRIHRDNSHVYYEPVSKCVTYLLESNRCIVESLTEYLDWLYQWTSHNLDDSHFRQYKLETKSSQHEFNIGTNTWDKMQLHVEQSLRQLESENMLLLLNMYINDIQMCLGTLVLVFYKSKFLRLSELESVLRIGLPYMYGIPESMDSKLVQLFDPDDINNHLVDVIRIDEQRQYFRRQQEVIRFLYVILFAECLTPNNSFHSSDTDTALDRIDTSSSAASSVDGFSDIERFNEAVVRVLELNIDTNDMCAVLILFWGLYLQSNHKASTGDMSVRALTIAFDNNGLKKLTEIVEKQLAPSSSITAFEHTKMQQYGYLFEYLKQTSLTDSYAISTPYPMDMIEGEDNLDATLYRMLVQEVFHQLTESLCSNMRSNSPAIKVVHHIDFAPMDLMVRLQEICYARQEELCIKMWREFDTYISYLAQPATSVGLLNNRVVHPLVQFIDILLHISQHQPSHLFRVLNAVIFSQEACLKVLELLSLVKVKKMTLCPADCLSKLEYKNQAVVLRKNAPINLISKYGKYDLEHNRTDKIREVSMVYPRARNQALDVTGSVVQTLQGGSVCLVEWEETTCWFDILLDTQNHASSAVATVLNCLYSTSGSSKLNRQQVKDLQSQYDSLMDEANSSGCLLKTLLLLGDSVTMQYLNAALDECLLFTVLQQYDLSVFVSPLKERSITLFDLTQKQPTLLRETIDAVVAEVEADNPQFMWMDRCYKHLKSSYEHVMNALQFQYEHRLDHILSTIVKPLRLPFSLPVAVSSSDLAYCATNLNGSNAEMLNLADVEYSHDLYTYGLSKKLNMDLLSNARYSRLLIHSIQLCDVILLTERTRWFDALMRELLQPLDTHFDLEGKDWLSYLFMHLMKLYQVSPGAHRNSNLLGMAGVYCHLAETLLITASSLQMMRGIKVFELGGSNVNDPVSSSQNDNRITHLLTNMTLFMLDVLSSASGIGSGNSTYRYLIASSLSLVGYIFKQASFKECDHPHRINTLERRLCEFVLSRLRDQPSVFMSMIDIAASLSLYGARAALHSAALSPHQDVDPGTVKFIFSKSSTSFSSIRDSDDVRRACCSPIDIATLSESLSHEEIQEMIQLSIQAFDFMNSFFDVCSQYYPEYLMFVIKTICLKPGVRFSETNLVFNNSTFTHSLVNKSVFTSKSFFHAVIGLQNFNLSSDELMYFLDASYFALMCNLLSFEIPVSLSQLFKNDTSCLEVRASQFIHRVFCAVTIYNNTLDSQSQSQITRPSHGSVKTQGCFVPLTFIDCISLKNIVSFTLLLNNSLREAIDSTDSSSVESFKNEKALSVLNFLLLLAAEQTASFSLLLCVTDKDSENTQNIASDQTSVIAEGNKDLSVQTQNQVQLLPQTIQDILYNATQLYKTKSWLLRKTLELTFVLISNISHSGINQCVMSLLRMPEFWTLVTVPLTEKIDFESLTSIRTAQDSSSVLSKDLTNRLSAEDGLEFLLQHRGSLLHEVDSKLMSSEYSHFSTTDKLCHQIMCHVACLKLLTAERYGIFFDYSKELGLSENKKVHEFFMNASNIKKWSMDYTQVNYFHDLVTTAMESSSKLNFDINSIIKFDSTVNDVSLNQHYERFGVDFVFEVLKIKQYCSLVYESFLSVIVNQMLSPSSNSNEIHLDSEVQLVNQWGALLHCISQVNCTWSIYQVQLKLLQTFSKFLEVYVLPGTPTRVKIQREAGVDSNEWEHQLDNQLACTLSPRSPTGSISSSFDYAGVQSPAAASPHSVFEGDKRSYVICNILIANMLPGDGSKSYTSYESPAPSVLSRSTQMIKSGSSSSLLPMMTTCEDITSVSISEVEILNTKLQIYSSMLHHQLYEINMRTVAPSMAIISSRNYCRSRFKPSKLGEHLQIITKLLNLVSNLHTDQTWSKSDRILRTSQSHYLIDSVKLKSLTSSLLLLRGLTETTSKTSALDSYVGSQRLQLFAIALKILSSLATGASNRVDNQTVSKISSIVAKEDALLNYLLSGRIYQSSMTQVSLQGQQDIVIAETCASVICTAFSFDWAYLGQHNLKLWVNELTQSRPMSVLCTVYTHLDKIMSTRIALDCDFSHWNQTTTHLGQMKVFIPKQQTAGDAESLFANRAGVFKIMHTILNVIITGVNIPDSLSREHYYPAVLQLLQTITNSHIFSEYQKALFSQFRSDRSLATLYGYSAWNAEPCWAMRCWEKCLELMTLLMKTCVGTTDCEFVVAFNDYMVIFLNRFEALILLPFSDGAYSQHLLSLRQLQITHSTYAMFHVFQQTNHAWRSLISTDLFLSLYDNAYGLISHISAMLSTASAQSDTKAITDSSRHSQQTPSNRPNDSKSVVQKLYMLPVTENERRGLRDPRNRDANSKVEDSANISGNSGGGVTEFIFDMETEMVSLCATLLSFVIEVSPVPADDDQFVQGGNNIVLGQQIVYFSDLSKSSYYENYFKTHKVGFGDDVDGQAVKMGVVINVNYDVETFEVALNDVVSESVQFRQILTCYRQNMSMGLTHLRPSSSSASRAELDMKKLKLSTDAAVSAFSGTKLLTSKLIDLVRHVTTAMTFNQLCLKERACLSSEMQMVAEKSIHLLTTYLPHLLRNLNYQDQAWAQLVSVLEIIHKHPMPDEERMNLIELWRSVHYPTGISSDDESYADAGSMSEDSQPFIFTESWKVFVKAYYDYLSSMASKIRVKEVPKFEVVEAPSPKSKMVLHYIQSPSELY